MCRKSERSVVSVLSKYPDMDITVLKYLNRLSDYLFLLARLVKHNEGVEEEHWRLEK